SRPTATPSSPRPPSRPTATRSPPARPPTATRPRRRPPPRTPTSARRPRGRSSSGARARRTGRPGRQAPFVRRPHPLTGRLGLVAAAPLQAPAVEAVQLRLEAVDELDLAAHDDLVLDVLDQDHGAGACLGGALVETDLDAGAVAGVERDRRMGAVEGWGLVVDVGEDQQALDLLAVIEVDVHR